MTWRSAFVYFAREAVTSLRRSAGASSVAIAVITFALGIGAFVLLITENLAKQAARWQSELQVSVYLRPEATAADLEEIARVVSEPPWIREVRRVDRDEARRRFAESFSGIAGDEEIQEALELPASFEATLAGDVTERARNEWLEGLRALDQVELVDDDRQWLAELDRLLLVARGVGWAMGLGLVVAATLIIAGVVRLSAYLYIEEIAVLRTIGATEFFVRGPFYMQGLLQGLCGAFLALVLVLAGHQLVLARSAESAWAPLLFGGFLSWRSQGLVLAVGAAAGLIGAVVSLRRESLRADD